MALRILTLVALAQCSAGNDPTGIAENLNSTIATKAGGGWPGCPNKNVGKFKINYDQSICMDIALNGAQGPSDGDKVQVWGCNGQRNQEFIWCSDGHIVSAMNKNMCLDVPGGNPFVAQDMQMWSCNNAGGQIWSYDSNTGAIYNHRTGLNGPKGMCLDTDAGSTKYGTRVNNYYAHGNCMPWYAGNSLRPGAGNATASDTVDFVLV